MTKTKSTNDSYVSERTDKYFSKTRNIINNIGEKEVSYGVFQRRDVIAATQPAVDLINKFCPEATVIQHFEEGALVPSQAKVLTITGPFSKLVELETLYLQKLGFSQVCAYNAYRMSLALPGVPFLDMHGRHSTGDDMMKAAAYGASVGSRSARLQGAKGFIGTSNDLTAPYYPIKNGLGTMPHAIIGYAGSTLEATKMYVNANPNDIQVTTLVDYYGKEITDSIETAKWFFSEEKNRGKTFGIRLDTHGGRFSEQLNYEKSVEVVCKWLRVKPIDEYAAVRYVIGDDAFDIAGNDKIDKIRKLLFGTGVSAANIINTRERLDKAALCNVKIIVSSGFNLFKCQIMAKVRAPIDMVGTGSFLPDTLSETYATSDIYAYDGENSVKVGREWLFEV